MTQSTKCIICESKTRRLKTLFSYEKTIKKTKKLYLRECSQDDCGHIFQINYNKKDLDEHYKYPRLLTKPNKFDIIYFENRKKFIEANTKFSELRSMLEVGPGDEFFLKQFKKIKRYFYDLNPQTNRILRKYFNFENIISSKKKFDLISICHVLEHVYNPKKFLNFLKTKLSIKTKYNGTIFIEVPDFTYLNDPDKTDGYIYEHLHYFNIKSLIKLFQMVNINILSIRIHLDTKNRTCQNFVLQAACTLDVSNKKKNLISLWSSKNLETKKKFINSYKKNDKILFWGIGTSFFKFIENLEIKSLNNLTFVDQRDYDKFFNGLTILSPMSIKNKKYDTIIVCTAELENVKERLKFLNVKYDKLHQVKS